MIILHLEDNDADAELFQALLLREWPHCRIDRLWTLREFEAALQMENFDVILSDYSMSGFDGLKALEVARECSPRTPFIFLSGTIGEERAIAALKRGAVDYILKNSPARLISAVHGALSDAEREAARRRAEESLRRNREQFRQISESIDDFIVLLDAGGHCLYSNPAFFKLLEQEDGRAANRLIFDDVHPEDAELVRERIAAALNVPDGVNLACRLLLADGSIRHIEAHANVLKHGEGVNPTLLLAGRDVTERKQSEQLLIEQASLLANARDAICVFDLRFVIQQWNASAERIYGRASNDVLGLDVRELLFINQSERFDAALALTVTQGEWHGEFRFTRPDDSELIMDSSWSLINDAEGRPKSILCIATDVTSRKQLEQELLRAHRIEGLGMLAGGIAHDLNNILSPILMSVGLLRPLAVSKDDRMVLDTLQTSATHGSELVRQILLFARGGDGQRAEVRIGFLLKELESVLKTAVRKKIDLTLDCDGDLWPVLADATQIKQVLMNLCMNARDAMPLGGKIRITAANIRVEPGTLHGFHGEIPAGPYIQLSLADTGTGIRPEVLEKIFDPFFTTKEVGKGTGLGLSTIAGIVQSHAGAIRVESVLGKGTCFHIYLPSAAAPVTSLESSTAADSPAGRGELILVIDDDDGIRYIAGKLLEEDGYEVCTAIDGQNGLDEFRRQQDRIRVVICDQMMPGLSGSAVLDQIHREAPSVKLISMTGFCNDTEVAHSPSSFITLPKPLKSEILLRTIRHAIDGIPLQPANTAAGNGAVDRIKSARGKRGSRRPSALLANTSAPRSSLGSSSS